MSLFRTRIGNEYRSATGNTFKVSAIHGNGDWCEVVWTNNPIGNETPSLWHVDALCSMVLIGGEDY